MAERSLRDSNFVFFGGSAGIGRAAAVAIGQRGANVLIVGRGREAGEATAAEVKAAGAASAEFVSGDLSTVGGIAKVAAEVGKWKPALHGVMHTAMAAFQGKQTTSDGLEFAFALQYLARAALNRLLIDPLAASGDGRIVHIAGNVPTLFMPDLDDLQFEQRKWSFFKSVLGTHLLGFLHTQEATRRWAERPVTLTAVCVNSTKTKAMADPGMPLIMRLMGRFGTTPELSARNAVRVLSEASAKDAAGAVLRNPKRYAPERLALDGQKAARLWEITNTITAKHGVVLP
ncbi:SDR family NAD(P)-dependent oxidoreductase [Novosphingobium sp. BL-52-GroH]|uniref:SDR family NAD(P)-dependent oxidoreductase n=1 Tax=Novosphingobium sp. BL-52-GroH TaxID=3349877 RepID=UPI00384FBBF5